MWRYVADGASRQANNPATRPHRLVAWLKPDVSYHHFPHKTSSLFHDFSRTPSSFSLLVWTGRSSQLHIRPQCRPPKLPPLSWTSKLPLQLQTPKKNTQLTSNLQRNGLLQARSAIQYQLQLSSGTYLFLPLSQVLPAMTLHHGYFRLL